MLPMAGPQDYATAQIARPSSITEESDAWQNVGDSADSLLDTSVDGALVNGRCSPMLHERHLLRECQPRTRMVVKEPAGRIRGAITYSSSRCPFGVRKQ